MANMIENFRTSLGDGVAAARFICEGLRDVVKTRNTTDFRAQLGVCHANGDVLAEKAMLRALRAVMPGVKYDQETGVIKLKGVNAHPDAMEMLEDNSGRSIRGTFFQKDKVEKSFDLWKSLGGVIANADKNVHDLTTDQFAALVVLKGVMPTK